MRQLDRSIATGKRKVAKNRRAVIGHNSGANSRAVIGNNSNPRRRLDYDPVLDDVLAKIEGLTPKQVSEMSGGMIGRNTVYNWRRGKVRTPLHYTISAAFRAAGWEMVLRKMK